MLKLEPVKHDLPASVGRLKEAGIHFDLAGMKQRSKELTEMTLKEDFWDDPEAAQKLMKTKNELDAKVKSYEDLMGDFEDLEGLIELAEEMEDDEEADEILQTFDDLNARLDEFLLETFLTGEYDHNSAILSIHAGTGGVDAMDWAEMMLRMYTRWAASRGYGVKVVDLQNDTDAGIKSATFFVEGENAYGFLKHEQGVHRLVRISPFNVKSKRQTSFASLEVMPRIEDNMEVEINPEDLRIDTYRASGAGGQHVNKTDSAIRITHLPTNIVVTCQNERSQIQNKEVAMKILYSKLMQLKEQQHKETLKELKGDFSQITWGSQIRSYVFQPYTMVKDHRTGVEVGNVNAVMDGGLDPFISAELRTLGNERE
ncbi:peptide chain release factor 2 [Eubacterium pyruvativorans]|uniref:peptide chain release factor 2 n=1 Tax=Eubacterium pyruvativorans TaxID=155865 RepID=UPI003C6DA147